MLKLTNDQLAFLKSHGIAPGQVFDASACRSKAEREAQMDEQERYFYSGGALCARGGHSLRTKAGHCIQCDTSKIAYQLRSAASGYIYLAHSAATGLVKIGFTKHHPQHRAKLLRDKRYANANDWDIKRIAKLERDAGKKEFSLHAALEQYQKPVSYRKTADEVVECREVFACNLITAINAFQSATSA
ncbi:GIY-YIG nuclease family protein [Rhodocyclus tenuis]|uniref:GIY-YIG nuclease family protein n=1 Tax=Rhodocyclus tenuis TaxID=1066 RepID=UPI001908994E|nr:GIY-YIG nuclease family protein [Rhodocyclus tenuis]MBK1679654.1 hypothetical protein [Rhodocyclus tenuis]